MLPVFPTFHVLAVGGVLAVAVGFAAGWQVKGAFVAKSDLAEQKARDEMIAAIRNHEQEIAARLAEKLQKMQMHERVIEREKLKIVTKPIYNNVCLDSDGVRLINHARAATGGTAKPVDALPAAQ